MPHHHIVDIVKLAVLEAALLLLLVEFWAKEPFARVQRLVLATLAGVMVFTWSGFGDLHRGASVLFVLSAVPVVLGCGWLFGAAFSASPSARQLALRQFLAKLGGRGGGNRRVALLTVALVAALGLSWAWVGVRSGSALLIHHHEQFHFYLGAKYQKEVGSFDLYEAVVVADRETVNLLAGARTTRDARTFLEVPISRAHDNAARLKAKFTAERWTEFKEDWTRMSQGMGAEGWITAINDHGNSNSPAWSIVAHVIARLVPLSPENQAFLGWLDMLLMLGMWLFVFETFGTRAAAVGLLLWATPPLVFEYLSGSFLRWDWLFALGLAACFIKRGKWATAGAFAGFAAASKLFPVFFSVGLLLHALFEFWSQRRVRREYLRYLLGFAAVGAVAVVVSAAMFGVEAWTQYYERIQVAQHEKYYSIQYSLKTVFLQAGAPGASLFTHGLFPDEIKQALPWVHIEDYSIGFFLIRLIFTVLIAVLARRATEVGAFLLGPLLVFTWLTVNMYYWNMLGLLALGLVLRKDRPPFGLLLAVLGIFMFCFAYPYIDTRPRDLSNTALAVAALMSASIVGFGLWELWEIRAAPASGRAPTAKAGRPIGWTG